MHTAHTRTILLHTQKIQHAFSLSINHARVDSVSAGGYMRPHMRRFSWMMMSLTAAMTKRICIVSVAQVKCV